MPVRPAIEIGCNRVAQILLTASCDELRCLVEHEGCATHSAEHDAAMAAPMVGNSGSERTGELTRFAAELYIAPAGFGGDLRDPHALDDLVAAEPRLENPSSELGASERASA